MSYKQEGSTGPCLQQYRSWCRETSSIATTPELYEAAKRAREEGRVKADASPALRGEEQPLYPSRGVGKELAEERRRKEQRSKEREQKDRGRQSREAKGQREWRMTPKKKKREVEGAEGDEDDSMAPLALGLGLERGGLLVLECHVTN